MSDETEHEHMMRAYRIAKGAPSATADQWRNRFFATIAGQLRNLGGTLPSSAEPMAWVDALRDATEALRRRLEAQEQNKEPPC